MIGTRRIYLDYAATTPVEPEVQSEMLPYLGRLYGNPSSIHSCGQETKRAIENARREVASLIGALPEEIIFVSSGTEADNMAIEGVAFANRDKGNHIITTAIEHHAVLECCHFLENFGFKVTYVPVDHFGLVDPASIKRAITPKTILISVMHANNELGTIQPLERISSFARQAGVYFHTDAVQTVGHIPVNVDALGVDLLSISAHKLYGPKGVGALYVRTDTKLSRFVHGGSQERGMRGSTENVAGIVGFGKAAQLAQKNLKSEIHRLTILRDKFIQDTVNTIPGIHLMGDPCNRLPGNINLNFNNFSGESLVLNLDLEGICVSTGSACSTGRGEASHVLRAIGLSEEEAHNSLRLTIGKYTTEDDLKTTIDTLVKITTQSGGNSESKNSKSYRTEKKIFKGDGIIIFPDVTASIQGAKVLKNAGIENKLVAPPPKMRMGCDLALEIYFARKSEIEELFNKNDVLFSAISPI